MNDGVLSCVQADFVNEQTAATTQGISVAVTSEDGIDNTTVNSSGCDIGLFDAIPSQQQLDSFLQFGHMCSPIQGQCDACDRPFPVSIMTYKHKNGESCSRSWIVFSEANKHVSTYHVNYSQVTQIWQQPQFLLLRDGGHIGSGKGYGTGFLSTSIVTHIRLVSLVGESGKDVWSKILVFTCYWKINLSQS